MLSQEYVFRTSGENHMQALLDAFIRPTLSVLGDIATLISVAVFLVTLYLWVRGILRVWWRLGYGLSRRKIAIFSDNECDSLRSMLVDSKIFLESNIVRIDRGSIKKAQGLTLLLVDWKSFERDIDEILGIKKDSAALVIYALPGLVKPIDMDKINRHRNTIVVNFRGRLLNDILTSMMTTG